jgi:hypothetical protein
MNINELRDAIYELIKDIPNVENIETDEWTEHSSHPKYAAIAGCRALIKGEIFNIEISKGE